MHRCKDEVKMDKISSFREYHSLYQHCTKSAPCFS